MQEKTVLANGIRIVTEQIPYFMSVSTGIWINIGSRDETEHEKGLTHFVEHMLFKGTRNRNALEIAKQLDGVGGFANAFTSKENVCLHAKVLHPELPLVVDILSDILLNSIYDSDEIERERQVILQEINMVEDTPDDFVHILFQRELFSGNPLAFPIYGEEKTVAAIQRRQILDYLTRLLDPQRIVVAAAGKVDHQHFVDLIGPRLQQLPQRSRTIQRTPPVWKPSNHTVEKDLEQVHICLGFPGCSHADPDRFACHLFNAVLGGSMSSRLFQEVREKRGLAYSVYSFMNSHEDTGLSGIYAGVAAGLVEQTLEVIRRELVALTSRPIPSEELAAAKQYLKGSIYLNTESTDSRMNRIAKNELTFGRFVPLEEIEAMIDAVASEAIMTWLRDRFEPANTAFLLYGPVRERSLQIAG